MRDFPSRAFEKSVVRIRAVRRTLGGVCVSVTVFCSRTVPSDALPIGGGGGPARLLRAKTSGQGVGRRFLRWENHWPNFALPCPCLPLLCPTRAPLIAELTVQSLAYATNNVSLTRWTNITVAAQAHWSVKKRGQHDWQIPKSGRGSVRSNILRLPGLTDTFPASRFEACPLA